MTKEELIERLKALQHNSDPEDSHSQADLLLLEYINDHQVTMAFSAIQKWYA
jgi:hypothetical protein